jgi:tRNA threonylcarbamoyl adenosine modification protein YeaZ
VIVAIEAAATDLSLALAAPDGSPIADDAWTSERRQSAELLPRLLALLAREGRELRGVTAVGVGIGPGSFTGLRVAMALAKGLAAGLGCPIVGVPSLRAWLDAEPGAEAAVARAGAREAFVLGRDDDAPVVQSADEVGARFRTAPVVAAGELADAFGLTGATPPRGAVAVAAETARRLAADPAGDDLRTLEPAYLRPPRGLAAPEPTGAAPWR